MLEEVYYTAYFGLCAVLIIWLGWILQSAGSVFLNDAFGGNATLVRAVAQLLDVGFYLVSVGYVAVSYRNFWPTNSYSYADVVQQVCIKVGGLMLLLGIAHLFNLLLLALFRRRGSAASGAVAS